MRKKEAWQNWFCLVEFGLYANTVDYDWVRNACLCWNLCRDVISTFPGTTWAGFTGGAGRFKAVISLLQCGLISHLTVVLKAYFDKRQASVSSAIKISCLLNCVNRLNKSVCLCKLHTGMCVGVSVCMLLYILGELGEKMAWINNKTDKLEWVEMIKN